MLSPAHRLTSPRHFREALRNGTRAGSSVLVVHHAVGAERAERPALVGFVVSKAVGNAVVRNRVKRRLRHLSRAHIHALTPGSLTVVRATPQASRASFGELDAALSRCLSRVQAHAGSPS